MIVNEYLRRIEMSAEERGMLAELEGARIDNGLLGVESFNTALARTSIAEINPERNSTTLPKPIDVSFELPGGKARYVAQSIRTRELVLAPEPRIGLRIVTVRDLYMRAAGDEPREIHTRSTLIRTRRPEGPKAFRNGRIWAKDGQGIHSDPFKVDEQVSKALQTLRR